MFEQWPAPSNNRPTELGAQPAIESSARWNKVLGHVGHEVTITRHTWQDGAWTAVKQSADSAAVIKGTLAGAYYKDNDFSYARVRVITGYNDKDRPSYVTLPYDTPFVTYNDDTDIGFEAYGIKLEGKTILSRTFARCLGYIASRTRRLRRQKA